MIRYLKQKKIHLIVLVTLASMLLMPAQSMAFNLFGQSCQGAGSNDSICTQANGQGTTNPIAGNGGILNIAVNVVALIAAIIAVIMIIISGIEFITAGGATPGQRAGDPNAIKHARSTLLGAIIGLVIIALSWTITRIVIDRVIQ